MMYSFAPAGDREVIDSNSLVYTKPEKHPARILDFHDIFYVADGNWSVWLENIFLDDTAAASSRLPVVNERIVMAAGDMALLPAGFRHYGDQPCVPGTRSCYVHFRTKPGDGLASGKGGSETVPVSSFIHAGTTRAYSILQNIMRTFHSNIPHRALRCSALLNLLICELSNPDARIKTKQDMLIQDILEHIRENSGRFFTITQLAAAAGISPKSLTTRFRAETGQTIHQYQMDRKLEQISLMLKYNSHTSLKNLAYNFGFCDEFHLSSCFKKKFGVSPIHYSL
jgi:AraC-like DNA-binding protein